MTLRFSDKVALVTGSASGIGRAAAIALARSGANVVVADRDIENGRATEALIEGVGGTALFIAADLAIPADIASMVEATVRHFGRLDIAFNNAAVVGNFTDVVDCSEEEWTDVIAINLSAVWRCMKAEIPEMIKLGGGVIVNTSSVAGVGGAERAASYVAAKHGVIGLTRSAAIDFGPRGIRVNAVVPGAADTNMLSLAVGGSSSVVDMMTARIPLRRISTADEQANVVAWLCSDDASFVTGATIVVDGGQTIVI